MPKTSHFLSSLCLSGLLGLTASSEPPAGLDFDQAPTGAAPAAERVGPARVSPLGAAQLKALLSRLTPLKPKTQDRQDFALRPASKPAPKTGQRIQQPFPPSPSDAQPPTAVDKQPVEVVRYAPEGEVELAPQLSLTFNQPMVELSSTRTPEQVPVKLTPDTPGEWRWVGTRTLVFKPATRLPMATEFQAEVVGTAKPTRWTFSTPPPRLQQSFPQSDGIDLRPVMFLGFDQAVDPARVLAKLSLSGGGHSPGLRLAGAEEVAESAEVSRLVKEAQQGRFLTLVADQPLRPGTSYTLTVPAGTPSLEGPRTTTQAQSLSFTTFEPLRVEDRSSDGSPPGSPLYVSFNNVLDKKKFAADSLVVSPPIGDLKVVVRDRHLWLYGKTRSQTRYTVTLPATLSDRFGQQLGQATSLDIQMGQARPMFVPPRKNFVLLDPDGPPTLNFTTVNVPSLRVRVRAVDGSHWKAYHEAIRQRWNKPIELPGQLLRSEDISPQGALDEIATLKLDLAREFETSRQLLIEVSPQLDGDQRRHRTYYAWLQRSRLGANLVADPKGLLVWVNQLSDGKPLAGATVEFLNGKGKAESDSQGLARLGWEHDDLALVIRHQGDSLFIPRHTNYYSEGGFQLADSPDRTLWYVNDDRKLYKPGETVAIKGWLRRQVTEPRGDLELPGQKSLSYRLLDARGNEVTKGTSAIGQLGGFDFRLALPKDLNLGATRLELVADGDRHQHVFQVQEFRRPEFEVSAQAEQGSVVVGQSGSLSVEARYFSGGGLKDAPVRWNVSSAPTNFSPPNWEKFSFGSWTPWWDCYRWWESGNTTHTTTKSFEGRTNGAGKHTLDLQFRSLTPPRPHSLTATASVADVNRQNWTASATMLVHPARHYVGIRPLSTFVEAGKPLEYEFIVTDLDGKAVAGKPIEVKLVKFSWEDVDDDFRPVRKEVASRQLTSSNTPLRLSLPAAEGGTYQLEATLRDDDNQSNQSQVTSWVAGGKQPPRRDVEMQPLTLIPNKARYEPGEVAEILVQSPFTGAQALVTFERHGLVSHQLMNLSSGSATLKVPLEEAFLPNLQVTVEAVGQEPRRDGEGKEVAGVPPQPAQARGSLNLAISAESRNIQVEVAALQPKSAPGARNELNLKLKDASGKPLAQAEVAVLVVDEAVLALIGGDYANPWKLFYAQRPSEVVHEGVRQWIELALAGELPVPEPQADGGVAMPSSAPTDGMELRSFEEELTPRKKSPMGRMAAPKPSTPQQTPIRMRTDFSALAFYAPRAISDAQGNLRLPFKLPDNLTRYRIVALAASGPRLFGKGQASLVAQQPLSVRPSPPRFLNFGDRCELPIVLHNQSNRPLPVEVAVRVSNLKLDPARAGVALTLAPGDRREVRFPIEADQAGTARFQAAVTSGEFADAVELEFPVWTPATSESFATYGVLDQGAALQAVAPPGEVFPQFGGLEVSTSSTALAELTDAFLYLRSYPFECAEQISSRVLSTVALEPVLRAFEAPDLPTPSQLKLSLGEDIKKLQGMQNSDGGWDYWKRDRPSVPYVSLHVTHALVRLKQAGYAVSDEVLERALDYTRDLDQHWPADYPESCKRSLRAYALSVLKRAGRPDAARARQLIGEWGGVEKTPMESLGWLLPTLSKDAASAAVVAQIRKHLNNRVSESASTAQFTTRYEDGEHLLLASDHRDDAIVLEALIEDSPQSDLLPKLVRGLLDHRVAGRWSTTQENCFVLLALHRYFETFEKITPDFVARLWLGQQFAGEQSFRGRSADSKELQVPMAQISGRQDLVIDKQGPGRLYYRLGMKYAPKNLQLQPLERGFSVERSYEAVDDNRDVRLDPDGRWRIRAGARVKVHLKMVAPTMRYHVALVDPLPAGLEALNPALKGQDLPTSRRTSSTRGGRRWWYSPWWYEHENYRDERVEAFTQWLQYGVHEYSYYARATTPGQFVVPPTRAEEMYHPETFGRSASDRVVVE